MRIHPPVDPQDAAQAPAAPAGSSPDDTAPRPPIRSRARTWGAAAGLLAAGAIGGAALAGTLSANAATPSPTTSAATADGAQGGFPAHGSAAHEAAEKPVTGADATKAQAAAVKAVGSGTAGAVTTDASGSGYEVTVTASDGSTTEVHLDSSFSVMTRGSGHGGPGGDIADQPAG